jgi:hypothetical protein
MERDLLLLYIMAAFTGVAATALVIQMVFLFGILRSVRALQERATTFMDRWEPLAATAQQTLEDFRRESNEILVRVRELTVSAKSQMEKAETVLDEVSESALVQLERVDRAILLMLEKVEQTTNAVQHVMLTPVRQMRAIGSAVGAIIESLLSAKKSSVDQATMDEEMFI